MNATNNPRAASVALLLVLLALAGCRVGPDRPSDDPIEVPTAFAASSPRQPELDRWWRSFGDPELNRLVDAALAANRDVVAAAARVSEARALAGVADAGNWPNVSFAADRQWLYASRQAAGLAGAGVRSGLVNREQDVHRVGLDASWEIDLFGAVARRVEVADARAEQSLADLRGTELLVAAEVVSNYLTLRYAEQRLAAVEARVVSLRESLGFAQAQLQAGLVDDGGVRVASTELRVELARPALVAAEVSSARHRLAVLVGRAPQQFELPPSTGQLQLPGEIGLGVPADLLRRRPDLQLAEAAVAAATAEVGVATADLYPRFFLLGGAGLESQSFDRLFRSGSVQAFGGPSLQLPLFQGGALRQALAAAEARQRAALAAFAQGVLHALADVESAVDRHAANRTQLAALAAAEADAAQLAALARARQRAGIIDAAATLAVERAHLAATEDRLLAEDAVAQTAVLVFKALGGGFDSQVPAGDRAVPRNATVAKND